MRMGNGQSRDCPLDADRKWSTGRRKKVKEQSQLPPNAESSRVLFLLYLIHRTWNVVVEHVDVKNSRVRSHPPEPGEEDLQTCEDANDGGFDSISLDAESQNGSSYSLCSCSYCLVKEALPMDNMSESYPEGMASSGWADEIAPKDKQRPPIYNPEDYVLSLKKWGKKNQQLGHLGLYSTLLEGARANGDSSKSKTLPLQSSKDYMSPVANGCSEGGDEMRLRQFGSASELLTKLRADLRMAFPSFVQEFTCEPLDGVTLLLELLRNVQLSLSGESSGTITASSAPPTRVPQAVQRRALLDELACLQCLSCCCLRYPDSVRRLVAGSCGLYTLTVCIMSTVNKSRIIALQLLTKASNPPANGHTTISEALSTLRLRYGEPVRFRFLIGMIQSGMNTELQTAGLAFINALLASAPTPQRKLYIQAELEQAGFDVVGFKKMLSKSTTNADGVVKEIENYEKQLIDIDTLSEKANEALKEKDDLKSKLELLEKRVKILQEEKGILKSLEQCLKEKCCELQEEVSSLRSEHGNSNKNKSFNDKKKTIRDDSSPPEDEGISSSERSLSPENERQREPLIYEVYNVNKESYDAVRNNRAHHKKHTGNNLLKKSDDDETTIDEVIQELRNIVNDAESEHYRKNYSDDKSSRYNQTSEINVSIKALEATEKADSITSTKHSIHISDSSECLNQIENDDETEIVPSKLLPQPPRKSKSLVHLFIPPVEEGLICSKPDLYDVNYCSSEEESDSLLSASRFHNRIAKKPSNNIYDLNDLNLDLEGRNQFNEFNRRKVSLRRSGSIHNSEVGSTTKEHIDNLFYTDAHALTEPVAENVDFQRVNSLIEPVKYSYNKEQNIDNCILALNANMVKKPNGIRLRSNSRSNSNNSIESPLIPVTKTYGFQNHFNLDCSRSSSRRREDFTNMDKYFSPHNVKQGQNSHENHSNKSQNTFLIRRSQNNAGFYSGQLMRDAPASMTSLVLFGNHNHSDLKKTLSPAVPKSLSNHSSMSGMIKLTDMPSGLY